MALVATNYLLNSGNIQNVPVREGVYELSDTNKTIIYIGRSDNLQDRLHQHLNTTDPCIVNAKYFRYEVTWNSENRETELLEEFKRRNGRLPRCNDRL